MKARHSSWPKRNRPLLRRAGGASADPSTPPDYYDEFRPEPPYKVDERVWVQEGGGVFACDSPRLMLEMIDLFERAGLPGVIRDYLGEPIAVSAQKCTLRKAQPEIAGAWHQDGRFLPDARAVNVWLSLSHCGEDAPGLDLVPRRIDHLLESGVVNPAFEIMISDELVRETAGDAGVIRPVFAPGDALLFDELFLHQTGSDPAMPNPRYAVESWFFGTSAFPSEYAPLAI